MSNSICVLKFGSSVLRDEGELTTVVHTIYRHLRRGERVVAVVSALGDTTDELLRKGREVGGSEVLDPFALAQLLATGEASSVALLGLALGRAGLPFVALDSAVLGLRVTGGPLDGEPAEFDEAPLRTALADASVVVVPGFVGRDDRGRVALLGRGGSDLTALLLAHRLDARCVLYKDVDGLYERDPAAPGPRPGRYATLAWGDAAGLDASIVQPKAVQWARHRRVPFEVACPGVPGCSRVGPDPTSLEEMPAPRPHSGVPLRVTLLGLGTVGGGVYQDLASRPVDFEVVAVGVRDPDRDRDVDVPARLVHRGVDSALGVPSDVVVELVGGTREAGRAVAASLRGGRSVVTANKELVAASGPRLEALGVTLGARLLASASVGGAMPAIEAVRAAVGLRSFEGVLNGTCNFVLDRVAAGASFDDAVAEAQRLGFAEADPSYDLDGKDAASKLSILAREGFGVELPTTFIPTAGIRDLGPAPAGFVWRLVATCRRTAAGVDARVGPVPLPAGHPLADVGGSTCRLVLRLDGGRRVVTAAGAGRWPTTESVFADLLDLLDDHRRVDPRRRRRAI